MSGGQATSESPPEVPDEFAAAYREAYERALLDQTNAGRHRRPPQYRDGYVDPATGRPPGEPVEPAPAPSAAPSAAPSTVPVASPVGRPSVDVDLPERRGRLVVGTHRQESDVLEGEPWFGRVLESRLFVPTLLLVLAMLLVLGAYVLGRAFTAAVGSS